MAGTIKPKGHTRKLKHHRCRRAGIRIDMTPMVDVAFLLLTFFMVTTAFRRPQTIEITIPADKKTKKEISVQESNLVQLMVNRENRFYYKSGGGTVQAIEKNGIYNMIVNESRSNIESGTGAMIKDRYKLILVFKMHPKSPYENLVYVLDELNRAVDSMNVHYRLNQPAEKLTPRFTFVSMNAADIALIEKSGSIKP